MQRILTVILVLSFGVLLGDNFVFVEGGNFVIGCRDGDSDEFPTHEIKVSDFYISQFEVTQSEFKEVMEYNPSFKYGQGDNYPVYFVTWYEVVEFCNKKSKSEGLEPCYQINGKDVQCDFTNNGYRLPTEAEWEYAARAGKNSQSLTYSGSDNIDEVAVYSNGEYVSTQPVGSLKPNSLGIYDMSGNVYEWVWDNYCDYDKNQEIRKKLQFMNNLKLTEVEAGQLQTLLQESQTEILTVQLWDVIII